MYAERARQWELDESREGGWDGSIFVKEQIDKKRKLRVEIDLVLASLRNDKHGSASGLIRWIQSFNSPVVKR